MDIDPEVKAALGGVESSLASAIATWLSRVDPEGRTNRILVLFDWPGNPLFPFGLATRNSPLRPNAGDALEPFEPDEDDGLLDPDPHEFGDAELVRDCEVLNGWFGILGDAASPQQLMVAVSDSARNLIQARTDRTVWVIPLDLETQLLPKFLGALLPAELSGQFSEPPE